MKLKQFVIAAMCGTLLFSSCKKDDSTPAPTPDPAQTVTAISPTAGPKNTVVTITGTNFGTSTTALKVYFNGVQGIIQTATATQITATVPAGAGTGAVKVEKNTVQVSGPVFDYLSNGTVTTFIGNTTGYVDGTGTAALLSNPTSLVKDASGNIFVADRNNNRIRKITPAGVVTTFAGSGSNGFIDGTGTAAQLGTPYGLAIDAANNLYVGEYTNHAIRKITPAGVVTTIAGNGTPGFQNGTGTGAKFNQPVGLAVDASGNIFVGDYINNVIRKITPAGVVTTFAGSGNPLLADGTGTSASFYGPFALAFNTTGDLIVADYLNHSIRKITTAAVVTTIAGNTTSGNMDGTGTAARFNRPAQFAIDASNNIFICDAFNNSIRKVTAAGVVTTIAGNGTNGVMDGIGAGARFEYPLGLCADFANSVLYVADFGNHRIRKVIVE